MKDSWAINDIDFVRDDEEEVKQAFDLSLCTTCTIVAGGNEQLNISSTRWLDKSI